MVHCRTAKQMYKGDVNFEIFSQAEKISTNKLIYNGDVNNITDTKRK
jgi:tRNA-dihydrouridine synthase